MKKREIQRTRKEDVDVTTPLTYKSYISLRGQPYKNFIMIAELIDNSISSFENYYEQNGKEWTDKNPLKININVNFMGEEKVNEETESKYIEGSFIEVSDNGYGMDSNKLFNSMVLDNGIPSNSDKNIWGRGMKQCAYFFGLDFKVQTNNGKESNYVEQIFTDGKMLSTPYRILVKESSDMERGTKINIKNLYKDRVYKATSAKGIVNSLEWRYVKYIKKGLLKIHHNFVDFDGKQLQSYDFVRQNEEVQIINKEVRDKLSKNSLDEYIKNIERELENLIKDSDNTMDIDKKLAKSVFEEIKLLTYQSIENNEDLPFVCDTKIKLPHSKTGKITPIRFKFWLIPSNKPEKLAGIRLYEGERAITHIGIKDKDFGPWMGWCVKQDPSWRTHKRFAGELDLKKIDVKPSVDKSRFSLEENVFESIKKQIYTVFLVNKIFLKLIMKKVDVKSEHILEYFNPNEVNENLKDMVTNGKINVDLEKSSKENNEIHFSYEENSNKWEIITIINTSKNPIHLMSPVKVPKKDRTLQITVYVEHEFWKSIIFSSKKETFISNILSPLLLLVATSAIRSTSNNISIANIENDVVNKIIDSTKGEDNFE